MKIPPVIEKKTDTVKTICGGRTLSLKARGFNECADLAHKRDKAIVEALENIRMKYPKSIKGWHGNALQLRIDNLIAQLKPTDKGEV